MHLQSEQLQLATFMYLGLRFHQLGSNALFHHGIVSKLETDMS